MSSPILVDADDKTLSPTPSSSRHPSAWRTFLASINPLGLPPAIPARGNLARDHLANERTFLAYTRTCLSLATTGVALVQLFALSAIDGGSVTGGYVQTRTMRVARPLGAVVVGVGVVVLIVGLHRYIRTALSLQAQLFPPSRLAPLVISLLTAGTAVAVFAVVLTLEVGGRAAGGP